VPLGGGSIRSFPELAAALVGLQVAVIAAFSPAAAAVPAAATKNSVEDTRIMSAMLTFRIFRIAA
jgi:hypothetical protein